MDKFKLRVLMNALDISQAEFATAAGVSQPVVCRLLAGDRPFHPGDLERITAALRQLTTPERLAG